MFRILRVGLVTMMFVIPTGSTPQGVATAEQTAVEVQFSIRQPPESAIEILRAHGVIAGQLRHVYSTGALTWTGGFGFDGTDAARVGNEYRLAHAAMTDDLIGAAKRNAPKWGDAHTAATIERLEIGRQAFAAPLVYGALAVLPTERAAKLGADPRVRSATARAPKVKQNAAKAPGSLAAPVSSHSSREQWVPDDAYITVQPSSTAGERYILNQFIWNSGRALYFGADSGYEADLYLSRNTGTYLTRDTVWLDIPDVYWSTSLPWDSRGNPPYLDTRYGDFTSLEIGYTVGTPGGDQLATGVWYDTYVRGRNGDASDDWARQYPQQSIFIGGPAEPRDTWSMGSHSSCYSEWSIPVPTSSWHWNRFSGPWACP